MVQDLSAIARLRVDSLLEADILSLLFSPNPSRSNIALFDIDPQK